MFDRYSPDHQFSVMIRLRDYETGPELEKDSYDAAEKDLQERLYILFNECANRGLSCLTILEGWAASGKGDALKTMTVRLDPRKFIVYTEGRGNSGYPFMYPYWQSLPYYGKAQFLIGSWYSRAVDRHVKGKDSKQVFSENLESISNFERTICADNYTIFKFFLNISRDTQKARMKRAKKQGLSWIVARGDAKQNDRYAEYMEHYERILDKTDAGVSPWNIIAAENKYYTYFTIMNTMVKSLEARLGVDSAAVMGQMKRTEEFA